MNKEIISFLNSRGWIFKNGLKQEDGVWLDPLMRRFMYEDRAYEIQKERDACDHSRTEKLAIGGIKRCGFCNAVLDEKIVT